MDLKIHQGVLLSAPFLNRIPPRNGTSSLRLEYRIISGKIRREEILEIPEKALREALINAVTHRDYWSKGHISVEIYDDRVEITNLGGLPKGLDKKDFGEISVPRNLLIAGLMQKAGYIEDVGMGIKKMRALVKKAGLPSIRFKFGNFFTIIFPRKSLYENVPNKMPKNVPNKMPKNVPNKMPKNVPNKAFDQLDAKGGRLHKLLKMLENIDFGTFSPIDFANKQSSTLKTVKRDLRFLKEKGFISVKGKTKAAQYKVTEKYKKLKKKL